MVKLFAIIVVLAIVVSTGFKKSEQAFVKSAAAPAGHSGSPADDKNCTKCHKDVGPAIDLDKVITSDIPDEGYEPGKRYTITANFERPGHVELGFQISPQNQQGDIIGSIEPTSTQTKLVGDNNGYITHTTSGISASDGKKKWSFNWTAPAKNSGDLVFYGAFNASNNNNKSTGDSIFLSTLEVKENITIGIEDLDNSKAVEFTTFPNPFIDQVNIKYQLLNKEMVSIDVYDVNGRLMDRLHQGMELPGTYTKPYNFSNQKYAGGLYIIHLKVGEVLHVREVLKKN